MSIRLMSLIWEHSQQEGGALLMLLAIADHANDEGICWPSKRTLARKCRISERHAGRLIKKLVEDGEIEIKRGGGRGRSNLYKVTLVTPFNDVDTPRYRVTSESPISGIFEKNMTPASEKDDTQDQTMTSEALTVTPESPQSLKEPSLKSSEEPSIDLPSKSQTVWVEVLTFIASRYTHDPIATKNPEFLENWMLTQVVNEENGRIVIACVGEDPEYQLKWLKDRGQRLAETAMIAITGKRHEVIFVLDNENE